MELMTATCLTLVARTTLNMGSTLKQVETQSFYEPFLTLYGN